MRITRAVLVGLLATLGLAGGLVAQAGASARAHVSAKSSTSLVIGYEGFSESELMAYIYGDLLQSIGYSFKVQNAGTRTTAVPAIEKGKLDVLPEYAGSLAVDLDASAQKQAGEITSALALDNAKLNPKGVYALAPTQAIDQNDFVVLASTASKYHLKDLSDLKADAGKWTFGAPPECSTYYFCEQGLKSVYGISFKTVKSYDDSGTLTVTALKTGAAEVVELFSTDPVIGQDHFVQLTDNKHLEPADHLIPLVVKSLDTSKVKAVLAKANNDLTTSVLIQLESAMASTHSSFQAVASGFLAQEKLIS